MKRAISFGLMLVIMLSIFILISEAQYYESDPSKYAGNKSTTANGIYHLNTFVLEKYNVISYGEPYGEKDENDDPNLGWMKSSDGLMTKKNNPTEKGEYKYLGVNYYGRPINNDRWFKNPNLLGLVFYPDYKSVDVKWVNNTIDEAMIWRDFKRTKPFIADYMENTPFYDADHSTAGLKPTGYTLKTFKEVLGGDFKSYGILQTEVTQDTTGVVRFDYTKPDGSPNWTTVEIPPFPEVKCLMTAQPNRKNVPAEGADVVVTIDTSKSYVLYRDTNAYTITRRHYWASTDKNNYGEGKITSDNKCEITVHGVKPNSKIYIQTEVYSQKVADLNVPIINPSAYATAEISIGLSGTYTDLDPEPNAVLKAAPRGNEPYDVTKGIPSGKSLYANVIAKEYLVRLDPPVLRNGSVDYTVYVTYPAPKEAGGEGSSGSTGGGGSNTGGGSSNTGGGSSNTGGVGNSGEKGGAGNTGGGTGSGTGNSTGDGTGSGSEDQPEEPKTITVPVTVTRSYSYWEIVSFDVYGIDSATINNSAFPNKSVTLTPSSSYNLPNVQFTHPSSRYSSSGGSSTATAAGPEGVESAAHNAAPSVSGKSDTLIIDGKTILDNSGIHANNLISGNAPRDTLYIPNIAMDKATKNGNYQSSGAITYRRKASYNSTQPAILDFTIDNVNPVQVHTPVCTSLQIQKTNEQYNQRSNPTEGLSPLVLGRTFKVDISNFGQHLNIPGYGSQDYSNYIEYAEIRFDFDAYKGVSMDNEKFIKANTWYRLSKSEINNRDNTIEFCLPEWVNEGIHEIEIRSVAINGSSSNESRYQQDVNTDINRYAAYDSKQVEVSGRVYDLTIAGIDDPVWDAFFKSAPKNIFCTGTNNINGNAREKKDNVFTMPVMPGKNKSLSGHAMQGYDNVATKLGYAFMYQIKTIGNYYGATDFLQIKPTFWYVDRNGKNRKRADLYYSAADKRLVKIGNPEDTQKQSMKLDFTERGINPNDFIETAKAIFDIRNGVTGFNSKDEFAQAFPKVSQNGAVISKFDKILLSEPVRSFFGPKTIPAGVNEDIALASMQKWYGQYYLPSDCIAIESGKDPSIPENVLKDGYLIVNFEDIAVINDTTTILEYDGSTVDGQAGGTGDGWALEGYETNQGWDLRKGDVFVYYTDKRSTDDYYSAGTH